MWTVAELLGEDLDDDLKAITQGWDTREDMLAAAGDRLGRPTLDDQRTAVSTITAEEFVLLCVHLALTGADDPLYFGGALARAVTQLRFVYSDGYDHPVPPETMDDLVEGLNELLAERTEIQLEAE